MIAFVRVRDDKVFGYVVAEDRVNQTPPSAHIQCGQIIR